MYWKSAPKCDSFGVTIFIKIPFFRVSVTIEPGHALTQFVVLNNLCKCKKESLFQQKLKADKSQEVYKKI